ncbi:MAG: hypothetical protein BGO43_00875 [Gammaproteobacteria bacterium 39-13]|nr:DotI/IcmL family type IV secretion protein [Gammaproteobacteria bacterium]OJV86918.1 MAG: hypothetical protein BGO43_00875 [Gammaproteobacteria bacterium 39-13]
MRKILLLTGLSLISSGIYAEDVSLATLQMRMKEIEVRLSLLEREISELKESKTPSVPLNQSNLPSQEVLNWATKGIVEIYSYNYKNFPQVLTGIRRHFTNEGYDSYMKALDESKNLIAVQDKKLNVSAAAVGKGKVIKEGDTNGIYSWIVQIPILVTYQSPTETINQNLNVNAEIVRVTGTESPVGIAFHSITASLASATPQPEATTPSTNTQTPAASTTTTSQPSGTATPTTPLGTPGTASPGATGGASK